MVHQFSRFVYLSHNCWPIFLLRSNNTQSSTRWQWRRNGEVTSQVWITLRLQLCASIHSRCMGYMTYSWPGSLAGDKNSQCDVDSQATRDHWHSFVYLFGSVLAMDTHIRFSPSLLGIPWFLSDLLSHTEPSFHWLINDFTSSYGPSLFPPWCRHDSVCYGTLLEIQELCQPCKQAIHIRYCPAQVVELSHRWLEARPKLRLICPSKRLNGIALLVSGTSDLVIFTLTIYFCDIGASVWKKYSTEGGLNPDVSLVGIGVETTAEIIVSTIHSNLIISAPFKCLIHIGRREPS